jgi:hypothetical protein
MKFELNPKEIVLMRHLFGVADLMPLTLNVKQINLYNNNPHNVAIEFCCGNEQVCTFEYDFPDNKYSYQFQGTMTCLEVSRSVAVMAQLIHSCAVYNLLKFKTNKFTAKQRQQADLIDILSGERAARPKALLAKIISGRYTDNDIKEIHTYRKPDGTYE